MSKQADFSDNGQVNGCLPDDAHVPDHLERVKSEKHDEEHEVHGLERLQRPLRNQR